MASTLLHQRELPVATGTGRRQLSHTLEHPRAIADRLYGSQSCHAVGLWPLDRTVGASRKDR